MDDKIQIINKCMKKAIGEKNPDDAIKQFLKEAGTLLHAHAIYIFTIIGEGRYDRNFVWRQDGRQARADMQIITEQEFIPEWWNQIHAGKVIVDIGMDKYSHSLPRGYKRTQEAELSSLVVAPVSSGETDYGFLAFSNAADEFLHDCESLYEISASFVAVMLQQRQNAEYIRESSTHDSLTGVLSINAFWDVVDPAIKNVGNNPEAEKMAIIFMDVHHFKIINGMKGHQTGNNLLRELGSCIKEIAGTEAVGRSTADHFYILTEDKKAENIIQNVHAYMKDTAEEKCDIRAGIYTIDGTEISASLAAGRAKLARDNISDNQLDYYSRYDRNEEKKIIFDTYITKNLDKALEEGWVKLYLQPIVGLLTGSVVRYEALARWQDPVKGLLSPISFIGALEESRLLYKLDLYMIEKVCCFLSEKRKAGKQMTTISVNLSRHDLEISDIHERINRLMEKYDLGHELLAIEITESALMDNESTIQDHIKKFHEDGYKVWLDDFGSGYSSLNVLQNYDFDLLKIDMMFLRNKNEKTPVVLTDIVDMAKRIGMFVLSEGVETKEDYDFLHEIGCNLVQGYYISKPLAADECLPFLQKKGYEEGKKEDIEFYRSIGRVNVLKPHFLNELNEGSNTGSRDPISLHITEDHKLKTIYMNKASRDWTAGSGLQEIALIDHGKEVPHSQNSKLVDECLNQIHKIGDIAYLDYHTEKNSGRITIQMIAKDKRRRAYMSIAYSLEKKMNPRGENK